MSGDDLFERSLRALHDAAFDDAQWPAAAALLDEACGSKGNMLFSGDRGAHGDVDIFFTRYCTRGQHHPEREREYFEVWYPLDERVPRMRHLPDHRIVHVHELITDEERRRSVVYNELLGAWDGRNGLHVLLDGPNGSRIGWNILHGLTRQVELARLVRSSRVVFRRNGTPTTRVGVVSVATTSGQMTRTRGVKRIGRSSIKT